RGPVRWSSRLLLSPGQSLAGAAGSAPTPAGVDGLTVAPDPVCRAAQGLQLLVAQGPRLAGGEPGQAHPPDGHALQSQDLVPQPGQHAADLAVLALAQDDLQPGALALAAQALDAAGVDVAVAQPDALEQLLEILARGAAGHLDHVSLFDAEARVHEAV